MEVTPPIVVRPAWDDVWMTMALTIAERSLCTRAHVGCVLVSNDNNVVAATYNGPSPRLDHRGLPCNHWCMRANMETHEIIDPRSYADCSSIHAEASAIARADASKLDNGTLYVTSGICINCARLTAHTGIHRVVHIVDETQAYRRPEETEQLLRDLGVEVVRYAARLT